jgi:hypothetical protein
MVKPFFRGFRKNWLLGIGVVKMVTTGRLGMHLQKTSKLSKEWGEGHPSIDFSFYSFKKNTLPQLLLSIHLTLLSHQKV